MNEERRLVGSNLVQQITKLQDCLENIKDTTKKELAGMKVDSFDKLIEAVTYKKELERFSDNVSSFTAMGIQDKNIRETMLKNINKGN